MGMSSGGGRYNVNGPFDNVLGGTDNNNLLRSGQYQITNSGTTNHENGTSTNHNTNNNNNLLSLLVATNKRKTMALYRARQRANMSFFLVVMFFGVFVLIVLTEVFFVENRAYYGGGGDGTNSVFLMDENGGTGGGGGGGGLFYGQPAAMLRDRFIYEDFVQSEDYLSPAQPNTLSRNDVIIKDFLQTARLLSNANQQSSSILEHLKVPPTDGNWQRVNGTTWKFFVYSAYYDRRKPRRMIRIIGATKTKKPDPVHCVLWYPSSNLENGTFLTMVPKSVQAKVTVIRENWGLKYSACFVLCPLDDGTDFQVPYSVSVIGEKHNHFITNHLLVRNSYNGSGSVPERLGICVKPLHYNYNKTMQLLEFLELNRILGVGHFTFYNHSISPETDCVLKDYMARGLVTVLPWKLNLQSQKEIRTEGLFASLNDCLYRSMYRFSHILLIDLDEFVVPRSPPDAPLHNSTLTHLIRHLTATSKKYFGSYSFQNAFFYLQWSDDEHVYGRNDAVAGALMTVRKTRRRKSLHPHKQRSKYICRPEVVVEVGNHFVWEFLPLYRTKNIGPDKAILHHYRICEFGGNDCIKSPSVVDNTTAKYISELTGAVRLRYERLRHECRLADLPPPPTRPPLNRLLNMITMNRSHSIKKR